MSKYNWNANEGIYCGNCGKWGHSYRRCTAPITSLGVIVFRIVNSKPEYLMIQRKDTLGFVEFMRGKYNLENPLYLYKLFEIMTKKERDKIENNDFETVWNDLWMNKNIKQYRNEHDNSKKKFNILKKSYKVKNKLINFETLNETIPVYWQSPEWGFPKGRRNVKESDIDCANRELREETGLTEEDYYILDTIEPIEEVFLGTNNIRYSHLYYIGKYNSDKQLKVDSENFEQISEISNLKWCSFDECLEKIRPYNIEKKNVIKLLNNKIKCLI